MITEIVFFDLPRGTSRADLLEKYRQTASVWAHNEDLIRKYYFFDEERSKGGGVYIWKNRESAHRWHGDSYRAKIRELYGSEPEITILDTLIEVNCTSKSFVEI